MSPGRLVSRSAAAALLLGSMMCLRLLTFSFFKASAASNTGATVLPPDRTIGMDNQVRYAEALKNVMVSTIQLQIAHPEIANSADMNILRENAGNLVILFENTTDPRALRILVSLRSFYFGEGPGEVFDCLLLEKGKEILPFLRAAQANECRRHFGEKPSHLTSNAPLVCLSDSEFSKVLDSVEQGIRQGEACSLKDFH